MQNRKHLHPAAGFNLLELLIVLAVGGIMLAMVFRYFDNWRPQFQLETATRRVASLIGKARIEALRRSVTTVVEVDIVNGTLLAYADVNGNPSPASAEFPNYLIFNPTDPALAERRLDDYEIGSDVLPEGVSFSFPAAGVVFSDSVVGLTTRPPHADVGPNLLVFDSSGRVLDQGSYRVTRLGANYFEVGLTSLGGALEVRKFLRQADRPVNGVDEYDGFFPRGNADGGSGQIWVWY